MSRHRHILADERGFTMVTIMLSMFVVGLFAIGAWSAAVGDIPIARGDQDRKRAYEAAVGGAEWYSFQLAKDPNYWTNCTNVATLPGGALAPVNQVGSKSRKMTLPASDESFAIELLPATGKAACDTANPSTSMLQDGTLRIRSTGTARDGTRQIVTTYKRRSFIDFIYFTDRETLAPVAYAAYPAYTANGYDEAWATANCNQVRSVRSNVCIGITFGATDHIDGPMHTNDDSVLVCGAPTFGRDTSDLIEVSGPPPGYVQGCSGTPNFQGTKVIPAPSLTLPPSNSSLKAIADYKYTGTKCLNFKSNGTFEVYSTYNCAAGTLVTTVTPPASAVVYVDNSGACAGGYQYQQRYTNPATCGDVGIKGDYATNVTVGAANDIIIMGNLNGQGTSMLGLIADDFVRVYHPARDNTNKCIGNQAGSLVAARIDAAILAIKQSFIVDNWDCGNSMGNLTVNGAIAQKWRGPVGTSGGNGYVKDYNYDDRLRYRSPPQFLDPVQSAWRTVRRGEQSPVQ
jgi:hypothetical protein